MINHFDAEEKLIRAEIGIRDYIKSCEALRSSESVKCELRTTEALSRDLPMPLKIRGRMLGEGRHKIRYYTREELKKAVEKSANQRFPLKLDHQKDLAAATIGMVDKIYWSEEDGAIIYEAHVNDETHARNIIDGAVKEVSVNISATNKYTMPYGMIGEDLEFLELSAVEKGAYSGNTIQVIS